MSVFEKAVVVLFVCVPHTNASADDLVIQPLQVGEEDVRYLAGDTVLVLSKPEGTVSLQVAGFDHGRMSFVVTVLNQGRRQADIYPENIRVLVADRPVALVARENLMQMERDRADRQKIATAFAGAVGAGLANARTDTYRSTLITPYGTYRYAASVPSVSGQIQAREIANDAAYRVTEIDRQLSETIQALGGQLFKHAAPDPGESYSGRVVLEKVKLLSKRETPISITVTWSGQEYPFAFRVVSSGTPLPLYRTKSAEPIVAYPADRPN